MCIIYERAKPKLMVRQLDLQLYEIWVKLFVNVNSKMDQEKLKKKKWKTKTILAYVRAIE